MNIHCASCGAEMDIASNYCPSCGAEAPRFTLGPGVTRELLTIGYHCVACGELNRAEAQYCSMCGKHMFRRPTEKALFCPKCAAKNPAQANFCYQCNLTLSDWFDRKGPVAEEFGHTGSLVLHDKLTDVYYHFVADPSFSIGRDPVNPLSIPCKLLSGQHCTIDLKAKRLSDRGSTNGTYINRKPDRVTSVPLDAVDELNIGGTFTFTVVRPGQLFGIRLTAVLEDELCARCTHRAACEDTRKRYFVFLTGEGEVLIRKQDGKIVPSLESRHSHLVVRVENGKYYLTDRERNMERVLIMKKGNILPPHLELTI